MALAVEAGEELTTQTTPEPMTPECCTKNDECEKKFHTAMEACPPLNGCTFFDYEKKDEYCVKAIDCFMRVHDEAHQCIAPCRLEPSEERLLICKPAKVDQN